MKYFRKTTSIAYFIAASATFVFCYSSCSSDTELKKKLLNNNSFATKPAIELKSNMTKLWEDHITWTRNVIFCVVDGLPGTKQAEKRLLQNQVEFGKLFTQYYGKDAGKFFTELLYDHINLATEVIKASKSGNTILLDEANKKWYANGREIAVFFNRINYNWKPAEMQTMMNDHLNLTYDEAIQRIKKDYDADVDAYEKLHREILMMSDMLSDGIIKQFPEKFESYMVNSK